MENLSLMHEQYEKEDKIKEHAQKILCDLGLTMEDLRGKTVLDLGAGDAELGVAAKKEGIDVVSIDRRMLDKKSENISYVVGDSNNAPFKNESFDLIVSHAAPPTVMVKNINDVRSTLNEVKRLLKSGGEFRFGPLGITPEAFGDEKLFTNEEEESFNTNQRVERVKEKSLELLQSIDPTIKEDKNTPDGFYILKKS